MHVNKNIIHVLTPSLENGRKVGLCPAKVRISLCRCFVLFCLQSMFGLFMYCIPQSTQLFSHPRDSTESEDAELGLNTELLLLIALIVRAANHSAVSRQTVFVTLSH
jgi:hypothetical protein